MIFAFDEFELDAECHELRSRGVLVRTDTVVLRLLAALVRRAPSLVTREQLIAEVWPGGTIGPNALTVTVARAREAVGHRRGEREFIASTYGRGYQFLRPVVRRGGALTVQAPIAEVVPARALPMIGRDLVLDKLRAATDAAARGRGSLQALTGEPGIGKSYAVEVFERGLRSDVASAWGFCREAGDTPPLWPWLRLVREVIAVAARHGHDLGDDPVVDEIRAAHAALDTRALDDDKIINIAGQQAERAAQRTQLFSAIVGFFLRAAQTRPWLLVIEDLHRVDDASLELLGVLLEAIATSRIVLVVTLRPHEVREPVRAELARVLAHPCSAELPLTPLAPEEVAAYVATVCDDGSAALCDAVFSQSEGNPFFMVELMRQWLADGGARSTDIALPDVALDCIARRMARFAPAVREVLSVASVIGRSFEPSLLGAVVELPPDALTTYLDEAMALGVVVAAPDSLTAFSFAHELLRKVIYDALPKSAVRRIHLAIARTLSTQSSAGQAVTPSELAHHYYAALPESDLFETVKVCRQAAAAAAVACANGEVVRYTRRAIEALDMMERPSVRLRMGMLYTIAVFARADDAATYDRAARSLVSLAVEQRNPRMMVFGALILNQHPGFPALSGAATALTRALELLPNHEHSLRASALSALAISTPVGFTEESYALSDEAVRIARAHGTIGGRYVTLLNQLYLYGGPAHGEKPTALAREVEQLAHQHAPLMPMLPVDVALLRAVAALSRGDFGTVRATIDRATVRCRAVRNGELLWHVSRFRALSRINQGAFAQGAAQLEVLHRQAEAQSLFGTGPFCAFDRAVSLRSLRGTPALDTRLRDGLDYDAAAPPSIWSMKLRALAALGLLEEARNSLRAVPTPEALERLPCDAYYLGTLGHLAHATVRLHELAYVETIHALLAPYETYFAVQLSFFCEGSVPQLRGMLARALGRYDEAARSLECGIEMSERAGFLPSAAEARFELAQCLHERGHTGDGDRARKLSEEAESQAIRLAMHRLARKAAALRQLLGGAAPKGAPERGAQTGSMR